jgi:hypothetical protein
MFIKSLWASLYTNLKSSEEPNKNTFDVFIDL